MKFIAIILLFFGTIEKCHHPPLDFCNNLKNSTDAAKSNLDLFLNSIPNTMKEIEKFNLIKSWLLDQDCIIDVTIGSGYVRTKPPLKILLVKLENASDTIVKKITISIEDKILKTTSII